MGDAVPGWGSGLCCRVKDFFKVERKKVFKGERERDGIDILAISTTKSSFSFWESAKNKNSHLKICT